MHSSGRTPWRVLLRNSFSRNEVEAEFTGLSSESHSFPVLNAALQLLKDGSVVFLASADHVIDDTRQFVSRCGHRFGSAEPGFHPPKVIPEKRLTPMQALRCHPQSQGCPVFAGTSS